MILPAALRDLRSLALLGGVIALASTACSSDVVDNLADSGTKTSSTAGDGGMTGADAGIGDAGPCNPVTGGNCPTQGEICVFQTVDESVRCQNPAIRNTFEMACDPAQQNCDSGLVCFDFQNGGGPQCVKVCSTASGAGCDALTGQSTTGYACLVALTATSQYGFCGPRPSTCVAYDEASCGATETCVLVSQTETGCLPQGTGTKGQPCAGGGGGCLHGLTCLNTGSGATCYEPCNPVGTPTGCAEVADICSTFSNISFGICSGLDCNPADDGSCAGGQVCALQGGGTSCTAAGAVAVGQSCMTDGCAVGGFCVNIGPGPMCYEPCDAMNPCTQGQCSMLTGYPFGICM